MADILPPSYPNEEEEYSSRSGVSDRLQSLLKKSGWQASSTGAYGPDFAGVENPYRYFERESNYGSDLYVVQEGGESWADISMRIYGNINQVAELQRLNRSVGPNPTEGTKIILLDFTIDFQVPVPFEDFWNLSEFANEINAMDQMERILAMAAEAEQIWPNHGDTVFVGYDEVGDPFLTTDSSGQPLFWDPETEDWSIHDTGIPYTWGMSERDQAFSGAVYDPETGNRVFTEEQLEIQREMTLMGENFFRPGMLEFYAEQEGLRQEEDANQRLMNFAEEVRITEEAGQNSAWVPSIHGDPIIVHAELNQPGTFWDAISLLLDEGPRGLANVIAREGAEGRTGINWLERQALTVLGYMQMVPLTAASSVAKAREILNPILGEAHPVAVDYQTFLKLEPRELRMRLQRGQENTIKYMSPFDYWTNQLDAVIRPTVGLIGSAYASGFKYIDGIYRDDFDSDEEYEDYLAHVLGYDQYAPSTAEQNLAIIEVAENWDGALFDELSDERKEIVTNLNVDFPEENEAAYLGFYADGSMFVTNDPRGIPVYWNPVSNKPSFMEETPGGTVNQRYYMGIGTEGQGIQADAMRRWVAEQGRTEETRLEAAEMLQHKMAAAFRHFNEGNGALALSLMIEALQLKNRAAHWYSPYFMWSEAIEPHRYEAFIKAAAVLTLETGKELEPRVVRDLRRQYEHGGLDLMSGVLLDVVTVLPLIRRVTWGAGTFLEKFMPRIEAAYSGAGRYLSETKVGQPISEVFNYLAQEAKASLGTTYRRIMNNAADAIARTVSVTTSTPGVKGLDTMMDEVSTAARTIDLSGAGELPPSVTSMHMRNIKRIIGEVWETLNLRAPDNPLVKRLNPENWPDMVQDAYKFIWDKEFNRAVEDITRNNPGLDPLEIQARAGQWADRLASQPRSAGRVLGKFVEDAWRAAHATPLGPETLSDNIIWQIVNKVGMQGAVDNWGVKGLFWLYYRTRNFLFEWWLGLRPAWTMINYVDSSVRFAISSAGRLFSNYGFLNFINVKKLAGKNLIREEFLATPIRALKDVEGEVFTRMESVIERWLRGSKFRLGPVDVFIDAAKESILYQKMIAAGRAPTTKFGDTLRSIWDHLSIAKRTLAGGAVDLNSMIEFGLRQHLFALHHDKIIAKMSQFNIGQLMARADDLGLDEGAKAALKKLWWLSGDDPNALRELWLRAAADPQGAARQLFSELLPNNFEEGLLRFGLDPRQKDLIITPMIFEIEKIILEAGSDTAAASTRITEYVDETLRYINEEFARAVEEFSGQPTRIVQRGELQRAPSADDQVIINIGNADEELTVTVEQMRVSRGIHEAKYTMSPAYYEKGALQAEAMGKARTHLRGLESEAGDIGDLAAAQAQLEDAADAAEVARLAGETKRVASEIGYVSGMVDTLTNYRDNLKKFMKFVWPGPVPMAIGPARRQAWEIFDILGTQIYDSMIRYIDEAITNLDNGVIGELPSLQNLLSETGFDLIFEGTKLRSFRVTDDALGTITSFSNWQATNRMLTRFLDSFYGVRVNLGNAWEYMRAPYTGETITWSRTVFTPEEMAARVAAVYGDEASELIEESARAADAAWASFIRNPDMGGGRRIIDMWGHDATRSREAFVNALEDAVKEQSAFLGDFETTFRGVMTDDQLDSIIQGMLENIDLIRMWQDEILEIGRTIDNITSPGRLYDVMPQHVAPPRWLLDEGVQTYLSAQRGLAAERYTLVRVIESLRDYILKGVDDGSISLTRASLSEGQIDSLRDLMDDAIWRKATQSNIATDGSKPVRNAVEEEGLILTEEIDVGTNTPARVTTEDELPHGALSTATPDGNIKLKRGLTVDEFFNYLTDSGTTPAARQKQKVLEELAAEGITPDTLREIITDPTDLRNFLISHERSHIMHGDLDRYWAQGRDLLTPDKIEMEVRAIKDAIEGVNSDLTFIGRGLDPVTQSQLQAIDDMVSFANGRARYEGAVARTQFDMLEYGQYRSIDNLMKFISPFWMFQSRSPLFWIRTFAKNPEVLAWYSLYYRQQRAHQLREGATTSSGQPLNSKFGYWRIPGTTNWVAPLNSVSARYVLPRPMPYPQQFDADMTAWDIGLNRAYEYGRMFGFNPGPWITLAMYANETLDPNRFPQGGLISHFSLLPPYWQRSVMRALRQERYPNDPGLINPDVGWKDHLIMNQMLGQAAEEIFANPDGWSAIMSEVHAAMGYEPIRDEEGNIEEIFGAPIGFVENEYVVNRLHPRWVAARDVIEEDTWANQWTGFLTGVYPKEQTDAEFMLLGVRDHSNWLADMINSTIGHVVFKLDPIPESRHEFYREYQWNTGLGAVDNLYGAMRWIQGPDGEQLYGEERNMEILRNIYENEVTAAYYDSLENITEGFKECGRGIPFGSDSTLSNACYRQMLQARAELDAEPIFRAAKRDWIIGHATDAMIMERFEHLWWSYIRATKPYWYHEDGESYSSWERRVEDWEQNHLPMIAQEMMGIFMVKEISPRVGPGEDRDPTEVHPQQIPGNRLLQTSEVLQRLVAQTNAEGLLAYAQKYDDVADALTEAHKAIYFDGAMAMIDGWADMNVDERNLAELDFQRIYGEPPPAAEYVRWVMENYPGRFTAEQVLNEFKAHGGAIPYDQKTKPTSQRGLLTSEIWEALASIGPSENFKVFKEQMILTDPDVADLIDVWYEQNGELAEYQDVQDLHRTIMLTVDALNLGPPSPEQLMEWSAARKLNDNFRSGVEDMLGENIWNIIKIYGSLSGQAKKDFKKENKIQIDEYYDMRDFFARENQLWAKYYNISEYKGGVGLPGEGAEKRGEATGGSGYGSGGSRRSRGGGGGASYEPVESFVPQGYRSTYTVSELFDPDVIGSGGVAGSPYWPAGYGKGKPKEFLNEIIDLIGNQEPLSEPAKEYVEKQRTYKEYNEKLLKYNASIPYQRISEDLTAFDR